jgi:hypothetical protein
MFHPHSDAEPLLTKVHISIPAWQLDLLTLSLLLEEEFTETLTLLRLRSPPSLPHLSDVPPPSGSSQMCRVARQPRFLLTPTSPSVFELFSDREEPLSQEVEAYSHRLLDRFDVNHLSRTSGF